MNSTKPSQGSSTSSASRAASARPSKRSLGERLEQVLLGREVAVDGADADPGGAGDLVDLRVEAVLGELLARGVEDLLAVAPRVGALRARSAVVVALVIVMARRLCDGLHDKRNSDSV